MRPTIGVLTRKFYTALHLANRGDLSGARKLVDNIGELADRDRVIEHRSIKSDTPPITGGDFDDFYRQLRDGVDVRVALENAASFLEETILIGLIDGHEEPLQVIRNLEGLYLDTRAALLTHRPQLLDKRKHIYAEPSKEYLQASEALAKLKGDCSGAEEHFDYVMPILKGLILEEKDERVGQEIVERVFGVMFHDNGETGYYLAGRKWERHSLDEETARQAAANYALDRARSLANEKHSPDGLNVTKRIA